MSKNLVNILIVASLILFAYIYYPFAIAFVPTPNFQPPTLGDYIYIPKINAMAPIIKNVDPWDKQKYEIALKKGVAQAKDNPNYYFAHSSLDPWEMTRVNSAFLRLNQLNSGDEIIIYQNGEKKYQVVDKKEVWPNEIAYLKKESELLILQTCTPVGTSLKRLLVFAKQL